MHTIMIGKMLILLPAMYIMNKFIGNDLSGASAISHARFDSKCCCCAVSRDVQAMVGKCGIIGCQE